MKFTVLYRPTAENKLASLWVNESDRQGIADAADAIDSILKTNPLDVGESRGEDERMLIHPPLAVWYKVDEPNRQVHVLNVGLSKPKK